MIAYALSLLLSWHLVYAEPKHPWLDLDHGTSFTEVSALDARHAWAVGENQWGTDGHYSVLVRWDGRSWRRETLPRKGAWLDLTRVDASSPRNVWVVASDNESGEDGLLHYDGRRWRFLGLKTVSEALAMGGQRAWAFTDGHASLYDGTRRLRSDRVPFEVSAADALSDGDIWAVGRESGEFRPAIAHFDGTAWTRTPLPPLPADSDYELNAVLAVSPTEVWAAGGRLDGEPGSKRDALLYRWDGTRWTSVGLRAATITALTRHHGRIWAASGNNVLRQSGGRWLRNTPPRQATRWPITGLASDGGRVWATSEQRILSVD